MHSLAKTVGMRHKQKRQEAASQKIPLDVVKSIIYILFINRNAPFHGFAFSKLP